MPAPDQIASRDRLPVTVRPLQARDEPAWRDLWTRYLAFYETALPETVHAGTFRRLLDPDEPAMQAMVALDGDRAVGLVHVVFHRHCWRLEDICYLQDLYALPDIRGRGVGRALIEAVYAAADARGTPAVYWTTQHFNAEARRLYDRIGQATPFMKYQRP